MGAKNNAGLGSFYRSAHELIGLFRHGTAPHRNTIDLGRSGRNRSNVLHYPGANGFDVGREQALAFHSTVKPVGLIADLILDSTAPGNLVLDSFGGSGTTLIAAEKVGRDAALVELDPACIDVTIRRFEAPGGDSASHVESGRAFKQVSAQRLQRGDVAWQAAARMKALGEAMRRDQERGSSSRKAFGEPSWSAESARFDVRNGLQQALLRALSKRIPIF